ncbi:UDP-N-acetylglucosamine 2-epimerase (non-hydrolyzing) [Sphingomonas yunnanensis]|uniref:non-hydrolyzing UDP-N-acetylglucosamine 2-epimerase n=1 Tax=Sphingomonas yunnanensis TaxID=310400 RepID=UPI001CA65EC1|nr:UDP-N-acetylglucosamine 2-epimerase (non-hydrolyzing) [Sphingomonas yunnanensis]MBY9063168.1 UDP-N-acetylglucosamine 2-epimerase (non-hydrolyzing) [Sphingomonas yunnanensis]
MRAAPRILLLFGTRPEAIKMAPVIAALRRRARLTVRLAVTGQHRALLDQALAALELVPDVDLDLMRAGQPHRALLGALIDSVAALLEAERPARLVVQGDTSTAWAGAMAANLCGVPVAHVEAGLRSGDLAAPRPEEGWRRAITAVADCHFAPTATAAAALAAENVPLGAIHVTGNTGIDSLLAMAARVAASPSLGASVTPFAAAARTRRIVTVTVHRREKDLAAMARVARAVATLAVRDDVAVALLAHPAPQARALAGLLAREPRVMLLPPLDYPSMVRLLGISHLLLTDSGGLQEEAPALDLPVLVLRDTTERPEGIASGCACLVGTDAARIVAAATRLLDDHAAHAAMARARNPYGDGRAGARVAAILARLHADHADD